MKKFCELTLYHKVIGSLSILFWLCFGTRRVNRSVPRRRPFFCFPLL